MSGEGVTGQECCVCHEAMVFSHLYTTCPTARRFVVNGFSRIMCMDCIRLIKRLFP